MITFAVLMDMATGKVFLALAVIWVVPERHGEVPNAYFKASTEPGLSIFLHIPQGMKISDNELQHLGVQHTGQMVLGLRTQPVWPKTIFTTVIVVNIFGITSRWLYTVRYGLVSLLQG